LFHEFAVNITTILCESCFHEDRQL